jgi:hypothetical protein
MNQQTSGDASNKQVDPSDDAELAIFGGQAHINQLASSKPPSNRNSPDQATSWADGTYPPMNHDLLPLDSIFYTIPSNPQAMTNWNTLFGNDPIIPFEASSDLTSMPNSSFGGLTGSDGIPESTWPHSSISEPTIPTHYNVSNAPGFRESEFADDYWISLMRDAGLLDSLQLPAHSF